MNKFNCGDDMTYTSQKTFDLEIKTSDMYWKDSVKRMKTIELLIDNIDKTILVDMLSELYDYRDDETIQKHIDDIKKEDKEKLKFQYKLDELIHEIKNKKM